MIGIHFSKLRVAVSEAQSFIDMTYAQALSLNENDEADANKAIAAMRDAGLELGQILVRAKNRAKKLDTNGPQFERWASTTRATGVQAVQIHEGRKQR